MRWRLILEEYGPELIYTKGSNNIVADALSCLDFAPSDNDDELNLFQSFESLRANNAVWLGMAKLKKQAPPIFPLT